MGTARVRGVWEELQRQSRVYDEDRREYDRRNEESRIRFEEFIKRFDRSETSWKDERREMEARLAADRKEASERHAASLADFRQERRETKQEFASQRRWLMANFVAVVIGMIGLFSAFVFFMM